MELISFLQICKIFDEIQCHGVGQTCRPQKEEVGAGDFDTTLGYTDWPAVLDSISKKIKLISQLVSQLVKNNEEK